MHSLRTNRHTKRHTNTLSLFLCHSSIHIRIVQSFNFAILKHFLIFPLLHFSMSISHLFWFVCVFPHSSTCFSFRSEFIHLFRTNFLLSRSSSNFCLQNGLKIALDLMSEPTHSWNAIFGKLNEHSRNSHQNKHVTRFDSIQFDLVVSFNQNYSTRDKLVIRTVVFDLMEVFGCDSVKLNIQIFLLMGFLATQTNSRNDW